MLSSTRPDLVSQLKHFNIVLNISFEGIKKRVTSPEKKPSISAGQFLHNYSQLGDKIFDAVDEGLYQQEKLFNHLMGIYFRRNKNV